uniref:C6 domain-containing protein n=1 Tax=Panagrellus redivivus TaxID=6233 RepID=A0A7E4V6V3_PANRE
MFAFGTVVWLMVALEGMREADGCAATASPTPITTTQGPAEPTVTTTTVAVVTTTTTVAPTTTTTTVAPAACASCTIGQITFTPMAGPGTEDATYSGPNTEASGCLSLTAICAGTNTGPVFMQFNTNQGGPSEPTGTDVTAVLNCVDGNWVYAPTGQESRIITEVNCVAA